MKLLMLALLQLPGIGRKKSIEIFRKMCLMAEVKPSMPALDYDIDDVDRDAWIEVLEKARHILERADRADIKTVAAHTDAYPDRLYRLKDYPAFLFLKGDTELLNNERNIAVIGTRNPVGQSLSAARKFTRQVVENGWTTVSGLAVGIDTATHEETLVCGGRTVAVLPSGILNIYPIENKALSDRIVANGGLLVSEYAPELPAESYRFVERDRIQSGLSEGIIVVETTANGGTMHASRTGHEIGIPLYVYGNRLDDIRFSGNKELVEKFGAVPVDETWKIE